MTLSDNLDEDIKKSKSLIRAAAKNDGKLISPINLSLDNTKPVCLDRLKWLYADELPSAMRLTNTGETVIVSARWAGDRPCLIDGPLDDSYIFSQIHFHWGAGEHEGSEHTVEGVCYPMEMHVVFYKSQYETKDAALKKDDGVVVVVYLFILKDKSSPGLQWLSADLDNVVDPQTFTTLPLSPLSVLMLPFAQDYILYWGSLAVGHCNHVTLWLVSRMSLSINLDDLNKFRRLLNSRKEPMNKNFQTVSPTHSRTVFHVNPSTKTEHFLLAGTSESADRVRIPNYTQMSSLNQQQAEELFNECRYNRDRSVNALKTTNESNEMDQMKSSSIKDNFTTISHYGDENESLRKLSRENSEEWSSSYSMKTNDSSLPRTPMYESRTGEPHLKSPLKQDYKMSKKNKSMKQHKSMGKGLVLKTSSNESLPAGRIDKPFIGLRRMKKSTYSQTPSHTEFEDKSNKEMISQDLNKPYLQSTNLNEKSIPGEINSTKEIPLESAIKRQLMAVIEDSKTSSGNLDKETPKLKETVNFKSKLPVRANNEKPVLKSSLVQYFANPESLAQIKSNSHADGTKRLEEKNPTKTKPLSPKSNPEKIKKVIQQTFRKPLGINAPK